MTIRKRLIFTLGVALLALIVVGASVFGGSVRRSSASILSKSILSPASKSLTTPRMMSATSDGYLIDTCLVPIAVPKPWSRKISLTWTRVWTGILRRTSGRISRTTQIASSWRLTRQILWPTGRLDKAFGEIQGGRSGRRQGYIVQRRRIGHGSPNPHGRLRSSQ